MAHRVVVFEGTISRLVQAGSGRRWTKRKADAIRRTAIVLAPARTGRLKGSHRTTQNRDVLGRYQTGFIVSATAPYSSYVHGGTGPWITPKNGRYLRIPGPNPRRPAHWKSSRTSTVVRRVRGQRANPWLLRAARFHT